MSLNSSYCGRMVVLPAALFAVFMALAGGHAHAVTWNGTTTNFQIKQIYHTPGTTKAYTSWVGLWQMPNNAIQLDFTEITGPTSAPVWHAPILQSTDNGGTWSVVNTDLPATPAIPASPS